MILTTPVLSDIVLNGDCRTLSRLLEATDKKEREEGAWFEFITTNMREMISTDEVIRWSNMDGSSFIVTFSLSICGDVFLS